MINRIEVQGVKSKDMSPERGTSISGLQDKCFYFSFQDEKYQVTR